MHALPHKRAGVPPAGRLKPRSQSCTTRAQTQLGMHHYVQAYRITHNYCGHHRSPEPFQMCKASQIEIFAQTACPTSLHHASTCNFPKRSTSKQWGAHAHTSPPSKLERGTAQKDRKGQWRSERTSHALRLGELTLSQPDS